MANPVARVLARIGFVVITTFGKAFGKAYQAQAKYAAQGAAAGASAGQNSAASVSVSGRMMSPEEAYRVLNIDPHAPTVVQDIVQNYERMFRANDVTRGGSFYLQSKIFRAKQTLDRIHKFSNSSNKNPSESAKNI